MRIKSQSTADLEAGLLSALAAAPGPVSTPDLAGRFGGAVSGLAYRRAVAALQRLERAGKVRRESRRVRVTAGPHPRTQAVTFWALTKGEG